MMRPSDVAVLLTKMSAFDQRTIGAADVAAWHEALDGIELDEALAAVTDHYRDSDQRIMPVHIRRLVEQARRDKQRQDPDRCPQHSAFRRGKCRECRAEALAKGDPYP